MVTHLSDASGEPDVCIRRPTPRLLQMKKKSVYVGPGCHRGTRGPYTNQGQFCVQDEKKGSTDQGQICVSQVRTLLAASPRSVHRLVYTMLQGGAERTPLRDSAEVTHGAPS